jgi:hypothetical protein
MAYIIKIFLRVFFYFHRLDNKQIGMNTSNRSEIKNITFEALLRLNGRKSSTQLLKILEMSTS